MFSIKLFLKSLKHATRGLKLIWKNEQNFRFQIFFAILVFVLMFVLPTTTIEKVALIILICLVLISEIFNTVFESIADVLKPRIHPYVAQIKDMTSAMVLITSVLVSLAGVLIFIPKLIDLIK